MRKKHRRQQQKKGVAMKRLATSASHCRRWDCAEFARADLAGRGVPSWARLPLGWQETCMLARELNRLEAPLFVELRRDRGLRLCFAVPSSWLERVRKSRDQKSVERDLQFARAAQRTRKEAWRLDANRRSAGLPSLSEALASMRETQAARIERGVYYAVGQVEMMHVAIAVGQGDCDDQAYDVSCAAALGAHGYYPPQSMGQELLRRWMGLDPGARLRDGPALYRSVLEESRKLFKLTRR